MTKVCNGCKVEKSLDDFNFRLSGRDAGKLRSRCKICNREYARHYKVTHKEEVKNRRAAPNSKEKARASLRQRRKNPIVRLCHNLRLRLRAALQGRSKSAKTMELLGCTVAELKSWLSGWFQPGMSWENYGEWHIDHRRPCASFDLSDPEQQKRCFHYLNLQPLWAENNLSKGAKLSTI